MDGFFIQECPCMPTVSTRHSRTLERHGRYGRLIAVCREHRIAGEYLDIAQWHAARSAGSPLVARSAVAEWENAVTGFLGMPHAVAVSMGRRAMTLTLEHLGVGRGDEVILPAFTCSILPWLVEQMGAKVVPADIDPFTFNVTPDSVTRRISDRTRAIVVLHAFGAPCPVDAIIQCVAERGIPVIEDCAHALGAEVRGRPAGTSGYASFLSFQPGKPINTYGGGMVVTRDLSLVEYIRQRTVHDADDPGPMASSVRHCQVDDRLYSSRFWPALHFFLSRPWVQSRAREAIRLKARVPLAPIQYLSEQAKLGLAKLPVLSRHLARRREMAALLKSLLNPRIRVQHVEPDDLSSWHLFVVLLPCRAVPVQRRLFWRGVIARTGEDLLENCARLLGYGDCPNTAHLLAYAMGLPMYDDITEAEISHVAAALNSCLF